MPSTATKPIDLLLRPEFAPKVLDGTKRMTRRIIKPQPPEGWSPIAVERYFPAIEQPDGMMTDGPEIFGAYNEDWGVECRAGGPCDLIRFITRWAALPRYDHRKPLELTDSTRIWTAFDGPKPDWCGKSRPGRFMPLWMRERLPVWEMTEVRVERVQDASAKDILAEGVVERGIVDKFFGGGKSPIALIDKCCYPDLLSVWAATWIAINGKESWVRNDFVWVLSWQPTEYRVERVESVTK